MESEFERLRKKVENYPSASAYNRLAELARLNKDDPEAERICQRCLKEFPRNGQAYVILAEIALAAGRSDDALKSLHLAVERVFGGGVLAPMRPTMGGEDFSAYQQKAPGVFAFIGAGNVPAGIDQPHHHPRFQIDERSLDLGLRYLTAAVFELLE